MVTVEDIKKVGNINHVYVYECAEYYTFTFKMFHDGVTVMHSQDGSTTNLYISHDLDSFVAKINHWIKYDRNKILAKLLF